MEIARYGAALALACSVSLAGCGSAPDPNTPGLTDPTFAGIPFNFGSAVNAQMITVGQKIDNGLALSKQIVQTDMAGLCALAQKTIPVAVAAEPLLPSSTQSVVVKTNAGLTSAISSPSCQNPNAALLQDALNLAASIQQVTQAIKTPAATIAAN